MSKKSKGPVVLDLGSSYGVGGYKDGKARMKYQTLMQDYQELRKEIDVIRSKLEAGKQRKVVLAAEVRFLRRRYEYFVKMKTCFKSLEKEKTVEPPNLPRQTKHMKGSSPKKAGQHKLPPIPESKPKKKNYIGKKSTLSSAPPIRQHHRKILHASSHHTKQSLPPVGDLDHKGRIDIKKKTVTRDITPVFDLNQKERMHAHDLNQDNSHHNGKEVSKPSRTPIFDLNEISTGDEDIHSNVEAVVKFDEVKKSLMRGPSDSEVENELMLSVCRNAREGPSRVGKRKIAWQDPVALRV